MARRNHSDRELEAIAELAELLRAMSLPVKRARSNVVIETLSGEVVIEAVFRSAPSPTTVSGLVAMSAKSRSLPGETLTASILIADRLSESAREVLDEAGWNWLDRRGHLKLKAPGVYVDTKVQPTIDHTTTTSKSPLANAVGMAVAVELLVRPTHVPTGRPLAARIGRSASATAQALADLRASGLIRESGEPLVPELFWEVATHWHPERVALASQPSSEQIADGGFLAYDPAVTTAMVPVIDPDEPAPEATNRTPGWSLSDSRAALIWGAPVVLTGEFPPDFYVPSNSLLRAAVDVLGAAPPGPGRKATVAVAPAPAASRYRYLKLPGSSAMTPWPIAHPVIVALDLARDSARGREILEMWTPPEGFLRVW